MPVTKGTKLIHPVFKIPNMLGFHKDNKYIIDAVFWYEDSNIEEKTEAIRLAVKLGLSGMIPTKETFVNVLGTPVHQVTILTHDELGEFGVALIEGPDLEIIKKSLEPIDDIVKEKAQFKLNVHPQHTVVQ